MIAEWKISDIHRSSFKVAKRRGKGGLFPRASAIIVFFL